MNRLAPIVAWLYQNVTGNLVASGITTSLVWIKMHRHQKLMEKKINSLHRALRIEE